jgi:anti-anti-sigma factor
VSSNSSSDGFTRPDSPRLPLQISTERTGDLARIVLSGELDLACADDLDNAIRDCEETEIGGIVVDLTDLAFVDSSGLSVLLGAKKRIGLRISFMPSKHETVTRMLVMTKTDQLLI